MHRKNIVIRKAHISNLKNHPTNKSMPRNRISSQFFSECHISRLYETKRSGGVVIL